MVCSASVDILHMGVPKMHVIDHLVGPLSAIRVGKVGATSCNSIVAMTADRLAQRL